ncbi:zinc finger protein 1035 [Brachyistius frenatus]|uniref:zinc finger protein 1035 n=1 Tax=Brachyistius frenatus TaxID=100188 RepID=UPI0037E7E255
MLYGEPLSREESSCDTDETKLVSISNQYKETCVSRPDGDSMGHSQGQVPQLKSSGQMRKSLHPVVILKNLESAKVMSNSYHCENCQHTTHNVDQLIEHHHCCHSVPNFPFCSTRNVHLMMNEQAEKPLSGVMKRDPQPSSDCSQPKRKRMGRHRCSKCGLRFSKILHYIKHMRSHTGQTPFKCKECGLYFAQPGTLRRHKRVPGRCKHTIAADANSDASKTETQSEKDAEQISTYENMPKCYVKLVDITMAKHCCLCGQGFASPMKAKKHFYNVHMGKSGAVSTNQSTTRVNDEKIRKVGIGPRGKYKCRLCPRLFKYSYNRARHLRDCVRNAVYGGKGKVDGKYRCPLCYFNFTLASNRYRHIKVGCLRECLNRLAKEKANSSQEVEQQNIRKKEQKIQTKENEQKTQSKENEQRKPTASALIAPKTVPRYKCNLCPAIFCHASGKYRHMKKHELFKLTGKQFKYRNSVSSITSKLQTSSRAKTEESKDCSESNETDSNLALSCTFCGKFFSTSQLLKKHQRNHRGERPYRCLECGKGFKKRCHLIGHKNVHQRRIQCTVCRKILLTVGELIQHRRSHPKKGTLQCPDCHLQFQYPAHLLRHLDTHKMRKNKADCLEETTPSKPKQSLESMKEQNEPKQLQCSLCKKVFSDAQILRKHCLTHISDSSNQCPFCKLDFNSRRYLLRHMVIHTGDKPFSCTNCGKQFYRHIYLQLHTRECLPPPPENAGPKLSKTKTKRTHQCPYCSRLFSKKDRVKNHLRGHRTNSLHLCEKCGQYYGFNKINQHQQNCRETEKVNIGLSSPTGNFNESTLQTSQNVHKKPLQTSATKILPFKCPHCPQRFRFRSLLFRHLVSHTGVQPYVCMHCGHRYSTKSMCLQHEAFCDGVYKEGLPKLKSDASTKSANMPSLRETMQRPLTDEAEYKCKFCTKTFMKSRNLRRHILTHNEVKPYRCKACDSCFSRYDHLKVHQTRCKGKKRRLEVCIPKISLDDVGKGWQSKLSIEPSKKPETFDCKVCFKHFPSQSKLSRHFTLFHTVKLFNCTCGSSFSHEKSLKKHKKVNKCKKVSSETNASQRLGTNPSAENVTRPLDGMRTRILQRIQPYLKKKYKYSCSYCPRAFGNAWQLGVHTRLHTGERPFSCEYCGQRFIRKDYVKRHFPKCTKKPQASNVLCDKCGGFFSKDQLENHKKGCTPLSRSSPSTVCRESTSQSPPKGFSCAYCTSRFLLFSQLQEHFLSAHKLETMVPPVSTAPLQQHLSNIPNIKEEPIDESCNDRLRENTNLICKLDAGLDNEVPKSFSCPDCNMSIASKAGLTAHLRTHTEGHPFSCRTCKRGFWNKSLLRNHYRKCRNRRITPQQSEGPLKAAIDLALNDSVLVFKEASKTTGTGALQTNFSCNDDSMDDSKQNSEGNQLQSSSITENKPVQYQCSECDKSFTDGLMLISHLEDHGRQEQEKKRNTCPKCRRVCSSQANLEKHIKMHGIYNNYPCPDCSKMFYTLSDLETHRTCHDRKRPYLCKLCKQRFWTRPSLCNHYREDHEDDVFSCRFCNKAYAVKKSLARHYRKWHQKEQKDLSSTLQEKSSSAQPSGNQISTAGESEEDENKGSEDSDSDSAPYFPCHVCGKTFPMSESLEDHQLCHLGEKPHECAECGKCFFQASQLQQHQRMHKSEFQCQTCGRGFVTLFALHNHKHNHGKNRPHRCSKCDLSFTGPLQLAEHMSTHREENFPCDICNCVFMSKSSRVEHRKSHSNYGDHPPPSVSKEEHEKSASHSEQSSSGFTTELKYRCGVCSERFKDPEELSEHGCLEAKERPYYCSECKKHFLHASHLKKHRTTHQPSWSNREYSCNQCNSSFSSSQHFVSHLKSHVDMAAKIKRESEDEGPSDSFICPVCQQCFSSVTELIHHFPTHPEAAFESDESALPSESKFKEPKRHRLTSATEYECTECGQSFVGYNVFQQHRCSHQRRAITGTKYPNPSTKKSTPTYYHATEEEEEIDVTGDELYNCSVCSMQFSSKSVLLEHQIARHLDEKPFKCELCGKTFARRQYLKEHERRHRVKVTTQNAPQSSERAFRCIQCQARFPSSYDLSLHMRVHAEEAVGEYRCDMCYKSFSRWSLLKQHQESHVGEVVYECTECDKAFAFPNLLEEHQQTHAGSSQ